MLTRCHLWTKHMLQSRASIGSWSCERYRSRLTAAVTGNVSSRPPPKYDETVYQRVDDEEDRDIRLIQRISAAAVLICVGIMINDRLKTNPRWQEWSGRLKKYNTRWTNNDDLLVTFDARPSFTSMPDRTPKASGTTTAVTDKS